MKEEVEKLEQKQAQLVPKLKTIELPIQLSNCSTEIISQRDNVFDKLMEITKNAKHQIDVIAPLHDLRIAYANRPRKLVE